MIDRTFGKILVETIFSHLNSWLNSNDFDIKFVIITPSEKHFNIELKSIVAQHENLAAKVILSVRVSLRFFFSFRLNKNNLRDFFTDQ